MKFLRDLKRLEGFTLIEILVAMVVLAVGLLGMAAMTVLVMKGSRGASDMTTATNLCQLKMEELKDVRWADLGNNSSRDTNKEYLTYGLTNGELCQERDLNSQAKSRPTVLAENGVSGPDAEATATALGPYNFTRTFSICNGWQYSGTAATPVPPDTWSSGTSSSSYATPNPNEPPQANDCKVDETSTATRTEPLACLPSDISGEPGNGVLNSNLEKKIKILCTWRDRNGQCHSVHMDTAVVQLQ